MKHVTEILGLPRDVSSIPPFSLLVVTYILYVYLGTNVHVWLSIFYHRYLLIYMLLFLVYFMGFIRSMRICFRYLLPKYKRTTSLCSLYKFSENILISILHKNKLYFVSLIRRSFPHVKKGHCTNPTVWRTARQAAGMKVRLTIKPVAGATLRKGESHISSLSIHPECEGIRKCISMLKKCLIIFLYATDCFTVVDSTI